MFAAELAYCVPLGIPHSYFLGGKRRWTDDDRQKVLAYNIRESQRCPKCHQFTEDWQDENLHPVQPPPLDIIQWRCEPCAQWETAQEAAEKELDPRHRKGIRQKFIAPAHETDDG